MHKPTANRPGRPTPDYLPLEVVNYAASLGLSPKQLAEKSGLNPHRFYSFFGSGHSKIRPYLIVSRQSGISLDDLVLIMQNGEFSQLISKLYEKHNCGTIGQLAIKLGVSRTFLDQRLSSAGLNGLANYVEVARVLNLSVQALVDLCLR